MGKIEEEIIAFHSLDADELRKLLMAERRDTERLKKELIDRDQKSAAMKKAFSDAVVYEYFISEDLKVMVTFQTFDDVSIPSPLEPRKWEVIKTTEEDARRAVDGLYSLRSLRQALVIFSEEGDPES